MFQRQPQDTFLWPIILLPSLVRVAFGIHYSFWPSQDFEMTLLGGFLEILWLITIFFLTGFFLLRKQSKKALSFVLSVLCLWPAQFILNHFPVGDYLRLAVEYPGYQAKIDIAPQSRQRFDWGSPGFLSVGCTRTLIYDPSDQLPRENRLKDLAYQKKYRYVNNGKEYFNARLQTRQLFGHFYLVEDWHL